MSIGIILVRHLVALRHTEGMITKPMETETRVINRNPISTTVTKIVISLNLRVNGYAKAFESQGLQYYFFNCNKHGRVVSYPQGYNEILVCTMCNSVTKDRTYRSDIAGGDHNETNTKVIENPTIT